LDYNYEAILGLDAMMFADYWDTSDDKFMWVKPMLDSSGEQALQLLDDGIVILLFDDYWAIRFFGKANEVKHIGGIYHLMFPNDKQYTKDMVDQLKSDIDKFLERVDRLKAFI
jgi:hypothetical protein